MRAFSRALLQVLKFRARMHVNGNAIAHRKQRLDRARQCLGGGGWILGNLIDGTQAEYVRVPFADTSTYPVPDGVSDETSGGRDGDDSGDGAERASAPVVRAEGDARPGVLTAAVVLVLAQKAADSIVGYAADRFEARRGK